MTIQQINEALDDPKIITRLGLEDLVRESKYPKGAYDLALFSSKVFGQRLGGRGTNNVVMSPDVFPFFAERETMRHPEMLTVTAYNISELEDGYQKQPGWFDIEKLIFMMSESGKSIPPPEALLAFIDQYVEYLPDNRQCLVVPLEKHSNQEKRRVLSATKVRHDTRYDGKTMIHVNLETPYGTGLSQSIYAYWLFA